MLVLLLRIGDQRFGLDASDVQEIVPYVPLRAVPGAPEWVAGLLRHRDGIVPVVDLALLAGGVATERLLSTRIILLRRDRESERADPIGVVAAGVTSVVRIDEASLRPLGVETPDAPWLGPVVFDEGISPLAPSGEARRGPNPRFPSVGRALRARRSELLQLVNWKDLVPADVRAALEVEARA